MQLSGIGQYLEIYRKKLFAALDERKSITDVIAQVSGVVLQESDITLRRGVISIQTDSITRNQLFLYKTKILEEIKKSTKKDVFDIR